METRDNRHGQHERKRGGRIKRKNTEIELIKDIIEEFTEEYIIDDQPTKGFLV